MPKLVVLTGSLAGSSLELSANWATVGRAEGNTFQIKDTSISGRHCEILLRGDEVVVGDFNSTNGTFIQGERVTKAILRPGQLLRLGQVDLRLEASTRAMVPTPGVPSPSKPSSVPATPAAAKPGTPAESTSQAKKHHVLFVDDGSESSLPVVVSGRRRVSSATFQATARTHHPRSMGIPAHGGRPYPRRGSHNDNHQSSQDGTNFIARPDTLCARNGISCGG